MRDRHLLSIKRTINKRFKNRNRINLDIAKIIQSYSHKTLFEPGMVFRLNRCMFSKYFLVGRVISAHYVEGCFIKPFWYRVDNNWHMFPQIKQQCQIKCSFNPVEL